MQHLELSAEDHCVERVNFDINLTIVMAEVHPNADLTGQILNRLQSIL